MKATSTQLPQGLNKITQDTVWENLAVQEMEKTGKFQIKFPNLAIDTYQFRAYTTHDKITVKGETFEIEQ